MLSVCKPLTFCMLIWPEASKAQNSDAAVWADGGGAEGRSGEGPVDLCPTRLPVRRKPEGKGFSVSPASG
jgi:hypothetical protein